MDTTGYQRWLNSNIAGYYIVNLNNYYMWLVSVQPLPPIGHAVSVGVNESG